MFSEKHVRLFSETRTRIYENTYVFFQKQIPVKSNKDSDKAIIFVLKSIHNHDETLKVLGFCSMSGKSFPSLRAKRL